MSLDQGEYFSVTPPPPICLQKYELSLGLGEKMKKKEKGEKGKEKGGKGREKGEKGREKGVEGREKGKREGQY